jgi:hypothetical protein
MPSYNETWDETKPSGTRDRSLGDDDIREFKRAERERQAEDHCRYEDETGHDDVGYHKKTTLVAQPESPISVENAGIVYTKNVGDAVELHFKDSANNEIQLTTGGKINAEALSTILKTSATYLAIGDLLRPVGSIFESEDDTDPATLFGFGTWEALGAGQVLVGIDPNDSDFDTAGKTGGAKVKTIALENLPSSAFTELSEGSADSLGNAGSAKGADSSTNHYRGINKAGLGSGTAMDVMNPYRVVYRWKRIA